VYCAESVVSSDGAVDLETFRLDPGTRLESVPAAGPNDTAEVVRVRGVVTRPEPDGAWPYVEPNTAGAPASDADVDLQPTTAEIDLVPYYAWSNRGLSTMRVWIPLSEGAPGQSPRTRP
jgi:hypothetical protein